MKSLLLESRNLNLGPFPSELSVTVSKRLSFLLQSVDDLQEMRNGQNSPQLSSVSTFHNLQNGCLFLLILYGHKGAAVLLSTSSSKFENI